MLLKTLSDIFCNPHSAIYRKSENKRIYRHAESCVYGKADRHSGEHKIGDEQKYENSLRAVFFRAEIVQNANDEEKGDKHP